MTPEADHVPLPGFAGMIRKGHATDTSRELARRKMCAEGQ